MEIHVVGSEVVAACLRAQGVQDASLLVVSDPLSFGPILPYGTRDATAIRRAYWQREMGFFERSHSPPDFQSMVLSAGERLRSARLIVIWAGQSLDEQLFLASIVAALCYLGIGLDRARHLVLAEEPVTKRRIASLGELSTAGYKNALAAGGQSFCHADIEDTLAAWSAVTASTPRELNELGKGKTDFSARLVDRVKLLKSRYPSTHNGLNGIDNLALSLCDELGPAGVDVAVGYAERMEGHLDSCGDIILLSRLHRLASAQLDNPLLQLLGDAQKFRLLSVAVTLAGQAILRDEANALALNGIDDWIGGVHLLYGRGKSCWCCADTSSKIMWSVPRPPVP